MIVGDRAVVGDFGVARILRSGGSESRSTTMGGSVAYAPPETFDNRTESSSDQYALAITYYELRTGKLPFPEESAAQVMRDKLEGALHFDGVTVGESKVLARATSVNPSKRFPTARLFVESLQNTCSSKPAKRSSVLVSAVAAIGVVSAIAVPWVIIANRPQPDPRFVIDPKIGDLNGSVDPSENPANGSSEEPVDGRALYQEALNDYRQSVGSEDLREIAVKKAVRAIKLGNYQPRSVVRLGIDPPPPFNLNDSDENRALKRMVIRHESELVVKASENNLSFIWLPDSTSKQVKINGVERIEQIAWMNDQLIVLDSSNQLGRLSDITEIPTDLELSIETLKTSIPRANSNIWLGMMMAKDRSNVYMIDGEKGKRLSALANAPGIIRIFNFEGGDSLDAIDLGEELTWKNQLPGSTPRLSTDEEGRFFIVYNSDSDEIGNCTVYDIANGQSVNLLELPLLKELSEIRELVFTDSNGSFVFVGTSKQPDEKDVLGWGRVESGDWNVSMIERETSDPIVKLESHSPGSFIATLPSGALQGAFSSESGTWILERFPQFEDGLAIAEADSADSINAVCVLNTDWMLVGSRIGKLSLRLKKESTTTSHFEITEPLDSSIKSISVVGNRVVVLTEDVAIRWFDLDEILLTAEACKEANIRPVVSTAGVTVGS